jgi:tape measure domain-containing protein
MADIDPIILQLRADLKQYKNELRSTTTLVSAQLDQQERSVHALEETVRKSSGEIGSSFKGLAGTLATAFTGRELIGMIDSFTQLQNKLKVAGVESANLTAVQDRLFASAQKYGVGIGALGDLFGTLTNASKELGASQEQVFKLTDSVSAALKVSGLSATEASGALQQLGQSLRGGTIQAEEYNSLLDGLYPLLEAAANGSTRFGGSVATLTKQVKDGKVSSKEFFDAILNGSAGLEAKAAKATLTLSGAYTTLSNALTVYVGQAAQTSGVQSALAAGLTTLANNVDLVAGAVAVIATVLATKYVASAAAATLATVQADAALLGFTTRAEVAGFAIGSLARALAINGLIAGVTLAIGSFAAETARSTELVNHANVAYGEMRKRLDAASGGAKSAGDGAKGVGTGAATAEPKVRSFAGAVGDLADQLYRQAKAAKAARVELLGKQVVESQGREIGLANETIGGRRIRSETARDALSRGDVVTAVKSAFTDARVTGTNLLTGGRSNREAEAAYKGQIRVSQDLQRQLREAKSTPLASFVSKTGGGGGAGGGKKTGRTGGGGSSAAASNDAKALDDLVASIRKDLIDDVANVSKNFFKSTAGEGQSFLEDNTTAFDEQRRINIEINDEIAKDAKDKQSAAIYEVAGLYESLFQEGTDGIWRNFKDKGLRALALVAAQATIASFSKGGGGFGSLLGNIFQGAKGLAATGGRASGGYVPPNGVVRVNEGSGRGPELLRMGSQGGTVIPLGQTRAASRSQGNTTVVHAPQFNLRGAVVTADLYREMQQISEQSAMRSAGASVVASQRSTPGTLAQYDKLQG